MSEPNAVESVPIYPVVMAGGAGKRFWPVSRTRRPKQLLTLFGERSLIEETVGRLRPLASADRILVVTHEDIAGEVRRLLPDLPKDNILAEPMARNTAAAIGLAAVVAMRKDPSAVLAVMPSDHYIGDPAMFMRVTGSAVQYASKGHIVTLGVTPTRPETGYGYIRFSDFVSTDGDEETDEAPEHQARDIAGFVEKPSIETALGYLREGRYLWNSGMFFFRASVILEEIERFLPDMREGLKQIDEALDGPDSEGEIRKIYANLRSISIDYGVMEHTERIVVIPCSMGWSDVGSWGVLDELREADVDNTEFGDVVSFDAQDNVFYADAGHAIAALGVEGLVVSVSSGAVLVCPKDRAQDVKRIVDELQKRGWSRYL